MSKLYDLNKKSQNNIRLSKYFIGQPSSDYIIKQDFSIFLIDEERNIKKQIIDSDGNICNFPGIEYCEELIQELGDFEIKPTVRYEAQFENCGDGKFIMVWTVRPDGRFWADSWGFGAEDYDWVDLYTFIDKNCNFTSPFKLYSIGTKQYGNYRFKGKTL